MAAAVAHQAHAVKEQVIDVAAVEAAQCDGIKTRGATAEVGEYARGIVQRLADRVSPLVNKLLARHHRD